jgi:hypothetical protein
MDIAIFRLDDKEKDFKHYLTFNDLLAADSHDYSANFAGKRVWTVGYAAPRSKLFKTHFKRLVEVWKQDPIKGELWDGSAQGVSHPLHSCNPTCTLTRYFCFSLPISTKSITPMNES